MSPSRNDTYNAAVMEIQERYREYQRGLTTMESLIGAARRLLHSALAVGDTPENEVTLYEQFIELAKTAEERSKLAYEVGAAPI